MMRGKREYIKQFVWLLIALETAMGASAQKREISQAKTNLKSGKNLDKVEESMKTLLKESTNRTNEKIWLLLFEAQKAQYEIGNEKLYLKQKYDTAQLFNSCLSMFRTIESLDSLDSTPDEKGQVKLRYRDKHADVLNLYRPNLYNGGIFFVKKQNYQAAYQFFDTYIDCAELPLFGKMQYHENDKLLPSAAYWAVYCGYKMKDSKATLRHTYLALKDTANYRLMLQYLAETYKFEADTMRYVKTLTEGFQKYPKFPFFFPRLIEYYAGQRKFEKALEFCQQAMRVDSTDVIYRFATSTILLNLGRNAECIEICKGLIKQDSTLTDAYLNLGLAYFNEGVELDKNLHMNSQKRAQMLQAYKKALPALQRYKELAPELKSKWGLPLYTIYLNLNMGKEFDQIDRLLKNKKYYKNDRPYSQ